MKLPSNFFENISQHIRSVIGNDLKNLTKRKWKEEKFTVIPLGSLKIHFIARLFASYI